jgi:hypothetical protein
MPYPCPLRRLARQSAGYPFAEIVARAQQLSDYVPAFAPQA